MTSEVPGCIDGAIVELETMMGADRGSTDAKVCDEVLPPATKFREELSQAIGMADVDIATGWGMMQAAGKTFRDLNEKPRSFELRHIDDVAKGYESANGSYVRSLTTSTILLALNAAIEAARAGEQGRGFAVVADEVRKLAERTAHSTEEIQQVVSSIQTGADTAVAGMQKAVSAVDSLAAGASESTREITTRAEAMAEEVSAISAALKEQSAASNEIASRVERIVHMSEENSSSAQSSASSAKHLQELAQAMHGQISRFRL